MPPQYSSISSRTVMPAGARGPPGFLPPPRHGERAQPLPAVAAMADEPGRALLDDLPHPVHRLHVVLEGGTVEEAYLSDVRRAQARHAALALDRLDHRRLFAADVRSGAAAHVNRR